jgi:signal transduction histidine kinase
VPDADYYARQLVDAGFHEQLSELLPLLKAPNSEELMKMVIQVGSLMRYVASIRISSERTQKIVHMLKTQSHINLEEKPEPVDLVKSLDTVLEFRRHDLGKIEVIREYQPNLPTIQGFDDELAQVWTNLIVNAIHAMESEGRLTLGLQVEGNHVKVSITDSGKGIPPEVQARIFDPFFTTKPKGVGTGQGLPICQRILERHHGSLYLAHSHPGETTFVALLPLQSPS